MHRNSPRPHGSIPGAPLTLASRPPNHASSAAPTKSRTHQVNKTLVQTEFMHHRVPGVAVAPPHEPPCRARGQRRGSAKLTTPERASHQVAATKPVCDQPKLPDMSGMQAVMQPPYDGFEAPRKDAGRAWSEGENDQGVTGQRQQSKSTKICSTACKRCTTCVGQIIARLKQRSKPTWHEVLAMSASLTTNCDDLPNHPHTDPPHVIFSQSLSTFCRPFAVMSVGTAPTKFSSNPSDQQIGSDRAQAGAALDDPGAARRCDAEGAGPERAGKGSRLPTSDHRAALTRVEQQLAQTEAMWHIPWSAADIILDEALGALELERFNTFGASTADCSPTQHTTCVRTVGSAIAVAVLLRASAIPAALGKLARLWDLLTVQWLYGECTESKTAVMLAMALLIDRAGALLLPSLLDASDLPLVCKMIIRLRVLIPDVGDEATHVPVSQEVLATVWCLRSLLRYTATAPVGGAFRLLDRLNPIVWWDAVALALDLDCMAGCALARELGVRANICFGTASRGMICAAVSSGAIQKLLVAAGVRFPGVCNASEAFGLYQRTATKRPAPQAGEVAPWATGSLPSAVNYDGSSSNISNTAILTLATLMRACPGPSNSAHSRDGVSAGSTESPSLRVILHWLLLCMLNGLRADRRWTGEPTAAVGSEETDARHRLLLGSARLVCNIASHPSVVMMLSDLNNLIGELAVAATAALPTAAAHTGVLSMPRGAAGAGSTQLESTWRGGSQEGGGGGRSSSYLVLTILYDALRALRHHVTTSTEATQVLNIWGVVLHAARQPSVGPPVMYPTSFDQRFMNELRGLVALLTPSDVSSRAVARLISAAWQCMYPSSIVSDGRKTSAGGPSSSDMRAGRSEARPLVWIFEWTIRHCTSSRTAGCIAYALTLHTVDRKRPTRESSVESVASPIPMPQAFSWLLHLGSMTNTAADNSPVMVGIGRVVRLEPAVLVSQEAVSAAVATLLRLYAAPSPDTGLTLAFCRAIMHVAAATGTHTVLETRLGCDTASGHSTAILDVLLQAAGQAVDEELGAGDSEGFVLSAWSAKHAAQAKLTCAVVGALQTCLSCGAPELATSWGTDHRLRTAAATLRAREEQYYERRVVLHALSDVESYLRQHDGGGGGAH